MLVYLGRVLPRSFLLLHVVSLEDTEGKSSHLGTMEGKPREWKLRDSEIQSISIAELLNSPTLEPPSCKRFIT